MNYFDTSQVNKELVGEIIGYLATNPMDYSQRSFGLNDHIQPLRECSTPCCIAGIALIVSLDTEVYPEYDIVSKLSQEFLNLSDDLAAVLFDAVWPAEWIGGRIREPNVDEAEEVMRMIDDDVLPYYPPQPKDTT